jgi:hypothetical protein
MKRLVLALVVVISGALPVFAQVQGGSITGTVKDEQGGVLPGATVTAQAVDATLTFTTDGDGQFRFLNIAPGPYTLSVGLSGFSTIEREAIVAVGRNADINVTLKIAAIEATVVVTAPSPVVDATATGTATTFSSDELNKIPTSRDPFSLIRSVPGALVDRVNIAGNETGQQLIVVAKGARQQDTSWTLDGVEITDMAAPGQSATYFNFDNFEEVHVSTAGNDVRERTGALTVDMVVKRGGNQYHGGARGYFANDSLQSSNIPSELTSVTDATSDHITKSTDYGFDLGGPLVENRAWFYGSYSRQDVGLFRRTTNAIDRTRLDNPNVKVNWQATPKDMVNFLFYNGYKIKDHRKPGLAAIEAPEATFHQANFYSDSSPLHGLWKVANDRVLGPNAFLSVKYAYFNTGVALTPEGGFDAQAGFDAPASRTYGGIQRQVSSRPQHTATADAHSFFTKLSGTHDVKYGGGYRTTDVITENMWPGNGIRAIIQTPTDLRAQAFREGRGGNRANYFDLYAGDTMSKGRLTLNLGIRYDRQWGEADPSTTQANPAFPELVPGIEFAGYRSPFTWNNLSPRAGITYTLDESRRTNLRVNYTSFAGQLATSTVGFMNPASSLGSITYRWADLNGDGFAQGNEVNTSQVLSSSGINLNNPTAVTSPNQLDPNLKAPVTRSLVAGLDRELAPHLAAQVAYTYSQTSNLFGNAAASITPRVGVPLNSGYTAGPVLTGTLPDGSTYSVPTFMPIASLVSAGGGGFYGTNVPGYYSDYNGVEVALMKRLSKKWMSRVSFAYNNAREHFSDPAGRYNNSGNPTPTVTEPLVDGGQFVAATGSGGGAYYLNAKWQFNANGMYQAPYGLEVSGNVFGRQGYPFPIYRPQAVGSDTLNVLVSPEVDTFRYPNAWDTDLRVARQFTFQALKVRVMADVFNVFNGNAALLRINSLGGTNNVTPPSFNTLSQNVTPRIVRLGLVVGF